MQAKMQLRKAILAKLTSKEAQDILNEEMPGYRVISPSSRDEDENDANRPVRAEAVAPDVSRYRQKFGAKQQADPTPKNPNPTASSDTAAPSSSSEEDLAFFVGKHALTSPAAEHESPNEAGEAQIVRVQREDAPDIRDLPSQSSAVVIDPKRPPGKRIIGYKS
jgi:hypothetical protein